MTIAAPPAASGAPDAAELVVMGRLAGAHGVKGWTRVMPFTAGPEALLDHTVWRIAEGEGRWRECGVEAASVRGGKLVAKLAGVTTPEAADALKGREIAVPYGSLPAPAADEYYWTELTGMAVRNHAGEVLGTVSRLIETGANDVLVVQGEREHLIPFVAVYVLDVDRAARSITVDWGLDY